MNGLWFENRFSTTKRKRKKISRNSNNQTFPYFLWLSIYHPDAKNIFHWSSHFFFVLWNTNTSNWNVIIKQIIYLFVIIRKKLQGCLWLCLVLYYVSIALVWQFSPALALLVQIFQWVRKQEMIMVIGLSLNLFLALSNNTLNCCCGKSLANSPNGLWHFWNHTVTFFSSYKWSTIVRS